MSPEQVKAKELDVRTDLFSFGAVLYEMVTGQLPFRGKSNGLIFNAILESAPIPVLRLNPDVPTKLEEIINKALEKDRRFRYQHASEMRSDLQRLRRDTDARDYRGHPYHHAAPRWRHRTEMLDERKHDQQGDDEPAVVKTDRNAGDSAKLDLCLHGRETSEARRDVLCILDETALGTAAALVNTTGLQALRLCTAV